MSNNHHIFKRFLSTIVLKVLFSVIRVVFLNFDELNKQALRYRSVTVATQVSCCPRQGNWYVLFLEIMLTYGSCVKSATISLKRYFVRLIKSPTQWVNLKLQDSCTHYWLALTWGVCTREFYSVCWCTLARSPVNHQCRSKSLCSPSWSALRFRKPCRRDCIFCLDLLQSTVTKSGLTKNCYRLFFWYVGWRWTWGFQNLIMTVTSFYWEEY